MKQIFTVFSILLIQLVAIGQQSSNLIIFAEDATPFYVILNGIKQNAEPQTNVKIEGLTSQQNQVKVIFKNTSIPSINKPLYMEEMNVEATMKIANTKKGYKLRYFGATSMGTAPANPEQSVIVYHTTEVDESVPVIPDPEVVTTTTTVVTEETTAFRAPNTNTEIIENSESINMDVNFGGVNFNMGVNVDESIGGVSDVHSSNSTVTTSTSTTTTTTTGGGRVDNNVIIEEPAQPTVYVAGYSGQIGCLVPSNSMASIKSAIDNESFSDDKMMIAKQVTKNKCLTTAQVVEIGQMFDFEDDKLNFAKYAYSKTYDVDNYYQVNSMFDFSSSKSELNEYISK